MWNAEDEVSIHKRAMDRNIGCGCARYFRGEKLHSGEAISEVRVMLYERRTKVSIDCRRVLLAKDVGHRLVSGGGQSVRDRHSLPLRLSGHCMRRSSDATRVIASTTAPL
jgi:hypothetical protein